MYKDIISSLYNDIDVKKDTSEIKNGVKDVNAEQSSEQQSLQQSENQSEKNEPNFFKDLFDECVDLTLEKKKEVVAEKLNQVTGTWFLKQVIEHRVKYCSDFKQNIVNTVDKLFYIDLPRFLEMFVTIENINVISETDSVYFVKVHEGSREVKNYLSLYTKLTSKGFVIFQLEFPDLTKYEIVARISLTSNNVHFFTIKIN